MEYVDEDHHPLLRGATLEAENGGSMTSALLTAIRARVCYELTCSLRAVLVVAVSLLVVLFAALMATLVPPSTQPSSRPVTISATKFSGDRALAVDSYLSLTVGSRPVGSSALLSAQAWLASWMAALSANMSASLPNMTNRLEVRIQNQTGAYSQNGQTRQYSGISNVLVRVSSDTASLDNALLVSCHLDSVWTGPGASDDGLMCSVAAEIVRNLLAGPAVRSSVVFNFNGAEESGLQGAHAFVDWDPWAQNITAFVNLDNMGNDGAELLYRSHRGLWLLQRYVLVAPRPFCSIVAQDVFETGLVPSYTDYDIYADLNHIPGVDVAVVDNSYGYHTRLDNFSNVRHKTVQHIGENIGRFVADVASHRRFRTASDSWKDQGDANAAVYYDILGLVAAVYPWRVQLVLNCSILMAFLLLLLVAFISRWEGQIRTARELFLDSLLPFLTACGSIISTLLASAVAPVLLALVLQASGREMTWFSRPSRGLAMYISVSLFAVALFQWLVALMWELMFPAADLRLRRNSSTVRTPMNGDELVTAGLEGFQVDQSSSHHRGTLPDPAPSNIHSPNSSGNGPYFAVLLRSLAPATSSRAETVSGFAPSVTTAAPDSDLRSAQWTLAHAYSLGTMLLWSIVLLTLTAMARGSSYLSFYWLLCMMVAHVVTLILQWLSDKAALRRARRSQNSLPRGVNSALDLDADFSTKSMPPRIRHGQFWWAELVLGASFPLMLTIYTFSMAIAVIVPTSGRQGHGGLSADVMLALVSGVFSFACATPFLSPFHRAGHYKRFVLLTAIAAVVATSVCVTTPVYGPPTPKRVEFSASYSPTRDGSTCVATLSGEDSGSITVVPDAMKINRTADRWKCSSASCMFPIMSPLWVSAPTLFTRYGSYDPLTNTSTVLIQASHSGTVYSQVACDAHLVGWSVTPNLPKPVQNRTTGYPRYMFHHIAARDTPWRFWLQTQGSSSYSCVLTAQYISWDVVPDLRALYLNFPKWVVLDECWLMSYEREFIIRPPTSADGDDDASVVQGPDDFDGMAAPPGDVEYFFASQ